MEPASAPPQVAAEPEEGPGWQWGFPEPLWPRPLGGRAAWAQERRGEGVDGCQKQGWHLRLGDGWGYPK